MRLLVVESIPFWEKIGRFCVKVGRVLINQRPRVENESPPSKGFGFKLLIIE